MIKSKEADHVESNLGNWKGYYNMGEKTYTLKRYLT